MARSRRSSRRRSSRRRPSRRRSSRRRPSRVHRLLSNRYRSGEGEGSSRRLEEEEVAASLPKFFECIVDAPTKFKFQSVMETAMKRNPNITLDDVVQLYNEAHREPGRPPLMLVDKATFLSMFHSSFPLPVIRTMFNQDALQFAYNLKEYLQERGFPFYGWTTSHVINHRYFNDLGLWIFNAEPPEILINKHQVMLHDSPRDDRVALIHHLDGLEREQFVWFCPENETACLDVYGDLQLKRRTRSRRAVFHVTKSDIDNCIALEKVLDDTDERNAFYFASKEEDRFLVLGLS